jgi:hypothetical protein
MNPKQKAPPPPQPLDVVGGIADRSANSAAWKYAALAAVLLGWVAVLVATLNGWL